MRPKSMILIVIALGCGLIASIGISQVMERRSIGIPTVAPTEKIYVALSDIPLGETLTAQMVRFEEWPQDKIPEGAIRSLEEIEGHKPLTRLFPGEPILSAKLIDANRFTGPSEKIPKGLRVVSVKVTMDSSASGLINPGDSVDILVFLKQDRNIPHTGTRTILKNVTVFAVNERTQRDMDEEPDGMTAKTVSLLVKPTQVEKVTLASELGKIKLSLRRSDDDTEDHAHGATLADLDGSATDTVPGVGSLVSRTVSTSQNAAPGGITDFLKGMRAMGVQDADTTAKEGWVMHIHTPADIQVFNWDDRNSLPRELVAPSVEASLETKAEFSDWNTLNNWDDSDGQQSNDTDSAADQADTEDAALLTE